METCRRAPVRGRLAPSPSGRMHLGNACSALLAWLSVRSKGGELILRLEDLDPDRCRPEYCRQVEEDFRWLGLDWDMGGMEGGEGYLQSRRRSVYEDYLNRLDQAGLLYPCYCSRGELHAAQAPHASDGAVIYPGTCRELTAEQRAERARVRRPALRVRTPEETVRFTDGRMGLYEEELSRDCGDFILRRSDGVHAYQLAVVVDDGLMGVTEVVRGRDLLSSTPRQIWLQRQLGFSQPAYFHTPLLTAPDGRRLSKRDADLDLGAIRASGVRPEAVVGWLAFRLGLLERFEPVAARELVPHFQWERVRTDDLVISPSEEKRFWPEGNFFPAPSV